MAEVGSQERPRAKSLRPLRSLGPFLRPYRGTVIAALAALVIASAAMLVLPITLRYVIDNGFIAQNLETVNRYFYWLIVAAVVFSLFAALRYYLVTWLGERVVADIR
ncbi:MAG: ABC transporter transmembrane domain-containing protein, partial [Xanthomonadales bacterium]|nr:ABC transporter transmembrane domain-containing protein [Xanthomonadales bacterium]